MKTVVYCGTRNLYGDMVTAAKSLVSNTKVDMVYFLIEDDVFPYVLPEYVKAINVAGQRWFSPESPNYNKKWTWMVLMRAALSKVFPELDVVLSLDVDTVVIRDISDIWDIDLGDNYYGACREPDRSTNGLYVNMGVAMMNLKQLRDGKDDEIIHALNTKAYRFCEQDCINELCVGRIKTISSKYNVCDFTEKATEHRIIHYAFKRDWRQLPVLGQYREMEWPQNT